MATTKILTEGWATAGCRLQAMLRRQLVALAAVDGFDLSSCGVLSGEPAGSGVPASLPVAGAACVYRLGGTAPDPDAGRGARHVTFWPAVRGIAGQGEAAVAGHDRIVVPSRWSRARLVEAGVDPARIALVLPGVDGALFSPLSHAERDAVRANLGFRDDETVFLNVGACGADAGLDLLLRAFARLRSAGSRARLVLKPDDPESVPAYDELIRRVGADEPGLLRPETLDAVVTLPGDLAPDAWRLLYGAADAIVSPCRAGAVDTPVLEAIACGRPVVVTRGAAADDVCDDDVAWRISGEVCRDAAGESFIAPDLGELTDALAEVSQGRGFDRLRFASARMRLLRDLTWERSARALAGVLAGAEEGEAAAAQPAIQRYGMPQPTGRHLLVAPGRDVATIRRRARVVTGSDAQALSVVVQGPCLRAGDSRGSPTIDQVLASIRQRFPACQIVVSTWIGSDVDGLDADDIVMCPDPGCLEHPMHRPNNVNRMVTSTANGLAAATRPLCLKTRNDLLFGSDKIVRRPLRRASPASGLDRRIWALAGRVETSLRAYHPSDMMMFGRTDDLRRLWNIPALTAFDMFLPDPCGHIERMTSEQALFIGYLNNIGENIVIESTFDGGWNVISGSIFHMLANFDVVDENDIDLIMPQRFIEGKIPSLCYTQAGFESLREEFTHDPGATSLRLYRAFHRKLDALLGRQEAAA